MKQQLYQQGPSCNLDEHGDPMPVKYASKPPNVRWSRRRAKQLLAAFADWGCLRATALLRGLGLFLTVSALVTVLSVFVGAV